VEKFPPFRGQSLEEIEQSDRLSELGLLAVREVASVIEDFDWQMTRLRQIGGSLKPFGATVEELDVSGS